MSIWGCNCRGDPVLEESRGIVSKILAASGKNEQEQALQRAQKDLVTRIYGSCWKQHSSQESWERSEIFWAHAYVEPEKKLMRQLESPGYIRLRKDLYLYKPAGFAVDDSTAVDFYDSILIPQLERLEENDKQKHWISYRLSAANAPPIVQIRHHNGHLKSDPDIGPLHELYNCLFTGDRQDGVYLHIAYVGRGSDLRHLIQAGCYLFLCSEKAYERMPRCLVFHLRAFVQTLVTAQLWALSNEALQQEKSVLAKLKQHSRAFSSNQGNLLFFLEAAKQIQKIVDHLSIDCRALELAKVLSNHIFDNKDQYHRYCQICEIKEPFSLKNMLDSYFKEFSTYKTGNSRQDSIIELLCQASNKLSSVQDLWCLAHACYKTRISLAVLTESIDDLGIELHLYKEPDEGEQAAETASHQICAATQLYLWKVEEYSFSFQNRTNELTIKANSGSIGWTSLKPKICKWWVGTRERGDLGGDSSEPWARVLRGLAGPVENVEQWISGIICNNDSEVVIPVGAIDERTT